MDEIEAIKTISDRLAKLSDDERQRVLTWAVAKFGLKGQASIFNEPQASEAVPAAKKKPAPSPAKPKVSKKAKSVISMDKSLNLSPSGKKSAAQFASDKAPSTVLQKCVVAVYYLRDFIELEKVSVSAVYTFFKTLSWPIPADLRNALQKAGSEGWLDTSDGEDIKLTSMGENVVEHSLPSKKA